MGPMRGIPMLSPTQTAPMAMSAPPPVEAAPLAFRAGHAPVPRADVHPLVTAALRILENSGARDLDVRQVVRTVGTSVSHLHRVFKGALGTSPLRYAREHLVRQAK